MLILTPKETGLPADVYLPRYDECVYCDLGAPHIHILGNGKKASPTLSQAKSRKTSKTTNPVTLKRSPIAKSLSNPAFRPQRVNSGKLYKRKRKNNRTSETD